MAIYHCSAKLISRKSGRSSTGAAAYRSASLIVDQRTGEEHDYTKKRGVVSATIHTPTDAPAWARDRSALWNAVEAKNKRADSQTAREFVVALPDELTPRQRAALVAEFAQELADRYHIAVDACIHKPSKKGDNRNHHAHLLTTTNRLGADGLGNKVRELDAIAKSQDKDRRDEPGEIDRIRARWAELANSHLAAAGSEARIDHRTLAEQGIDREASTHLGPGAVGFERRTKQKSRRREMVEERQAAAARATEIAQARAELAEASAELARLETLERQAEAERRQWIVDMVARQSEQVRREREEAEQRRQAAEAAARAEAERLDPRRLQDRIEELQRRAGDQERQHPRYTLPAPAVRAAWDRHTRAVEALDAARRLLWDEQEAQERRSRLMRPLYASRVEAAADDVDRAEAALQRALDDAETADRRHKESPAYRQALAAWEREETSIQAETAQLQRDVQDYKARQQPAQPVDQVEQDQRSPVPVLPPTEAERRAAVERYRQRQQQPAPPAVEEVEEVEEGPTFTPRWPGMG